MRIAAARAGSLSAPRWVVDGASGSVHPEIAQAKLAVQAEGAAIASARPKVHLNK
jgi:hypothetical protein